MDYDIAATRGGFKTAAQAYVAAEKWAGAHGLTLLDPTPFSDTPAIAVTLAYAQQNAFARSAICAGSPRS